MKQLFLAVRHEIILGILAIQDSASVSDILLQFETKGVSITRITLIRALNELVDGGLILRFGAGRSVRYSLSKDRLLVPFSLNSYFEIEPDKRPLVKNINPFQSIKSWQSIFDPVLIKKINRSTQQFQKRKEKYSKEQLKRELERITIEFSWKSSLMEGNTYSLLDTERLIRERREAPLKNPDEATMILNHKAALDYAWKNAKAFRKTSIQPIQEFHSLIVDGLKVKKGFRAHPVGIIGTAYKPHDNIFQIREKIEVVCRLINRTKEPLLKALIAVAGISYIQPFEDGNKRTARLLGNALLLAHDYCPLSYRSADEIEYKKALILFYEQHSIVSFKKLFLEQYFFATENYFM